jgi:hypothetical protein
MDIDSSFLRTAAQQRLLGRHRLSGYYAYPPTPGGRRRHLQVPYPESVPARQAAADLVTLLADEGVEHLFIIGFGDLGRLNWRFMTALEAGCQALGQDLEAWR